ncbi:hypothetical protein ANANG_G00269450 [Anguilla anguilla]|uniref:Uncharacterized protein n=1 Tax=Anguilla anguilla TaxID=7936 RepID=A0A9D3RM12_ANGAN|nr:hypothetical protein ANANG_G00269450 [Anguilla anguilla]
MENNGWRTTFTCSVKNTRILDRYQGLGWEMWPQCTHSEQHSGMLGLSQTDLHCSRIPSSPALCQLRPLTVSSEEVGGTSEPIRKPGRSNSKDTPHRKDSGLHYVDIFCPLSPVAGGVMVKPIPQCSALLTSTAWSYGFSAPCVFLLPVGKAWRLMGNCSLGNQSVAGEVRGATVAIGNTWPTVGGVARRAQRRSRRRLFRQTVPKWKKASRQFPSRGSRGRRAGRTLTPSRLFRDLFKSRFPPRGFPQRVHARHCRLLRGSKIPNVPGYTRGRHRGGETEDFHVPSRFWG